MTKIRQRKSPLRRSRKSLIENELNSSSQLLEPTPVLSKEQLNSQKSFNLVVDDVPYIIKAFPFYFNDELRYYVSINNGEQHVFARDSSVAGYRAIDDTAASIPDPIEDAISFQLLRWQR